MYEYKNQELLDETLKIGGVIDKNELVTVAELKMCQ